MVEIIDMGSSHDAFKRAGVVELERDVKYMLRSEAIINTKQKLKGHGRKIDHNAKLGKDAYYFVFKDSDPYSTTTSRVPKSALEDNVGPYETLAFTLEHAIDVSEFEN